MRPSAVPFRSVFGPDSTKDRFTDHLHIRRMGTEHPPCYMKLKSNDRANYRRSYTAHPFIRVPWIREPEASESTRRHCMVF